MKNYIYLSFILLFSCQESKSKSSIGSGYKMPKNRIENSTKKNIEDSIKNENRVFSELKIVKTIQSKTNKNLDRITVFDSGIDSPKSANYTLDGKKIYVNSLEGGKTLVYDAKTLQKIKEINHRFSEKDASLFKDNEDRVFDYQYKQDRSNYNVFMGKPVESCFSHNGKYLWVTYYRRNFDPHAESPSAIAIIDTEKDEIVRVMPSGPLPKMIACSDDNKYIAVTHWGDNTLGIIDISSDDVFNFKYIKHVVIDEQLKMNFAEDVDRDNDCGNCLRGTIFTPDNHFLLVGKMGGNGIAVVKVPEFDYVGTITGAKGNIRHLVINNDKLFLSSNKFGAVQYTDFKSLPISKLTAPTDKLEVDHWKTAELGRGVRTIEVSPDGKYIFACVNDSAKISVVETDSMKEIFSIPISKFPVGMAISPDARQLVVTSQGKDGVPNTGNAVNVLEIVYK